VNFLWTDRHRKIIFRDAPQETGGTANVDAPSWFASLASMAALRTIQRARKLQIQSPMDVSAPVHRFEESIAGRLYLIEVKAVSEDRWSACIMRVPGVPTALMPFYGPTPDEAARQLSEWLTRAYARAANPTNTV
jgi:hypothetical protein